MSRRLNSETPVQQIVVAINQGSVSFSPTDGDTVTGRVDGPGADDLTVRTGGGRLYLGTEGFASTAEINVQLFVPDAIDVTVRAGSADLSADVALGEVNAGLASGAIRLAGVARLNARAGSGDITAESVGDRSRLSSGSGDIRVGWMAGGSIKSGSGAITVEGLTGELRARTGSGDVTVGIGDDLPVWLDLTTRSGAVDIDLDPGQPPAPEQPHAQVQVRSASGAISIHR